MVPLQWCLLFWTRADTGRLPNVALKFRPSDDSECAGFLNTDEDTGRSILQIAMPLVSRDFPLFFTFTNTVLQALRSPLGPVLSYFSLLFAK